MKEKNENDVGMELDLWSENLRECERLCPNPSIEIPVCPMDGIQIGTIRKEISGGETVYIFDVREFRFFIKHDSRKHYPPQSDAMALMIYLLLGLNPRASHCF